MESGTKEKKMFCYEKTNFQSYVEKELTDITKRIIDRKNKEDTNMNIVRKDDLIQYYPAGHYDMTAKRAHSKDVDDAEILTIGRSEFLPGGGAEAAAVKEGMELVYYVTEGTLTITCEDADFDLVAGDSALFKAGDVRAVKNNTDKNAVMLVIAGVR